MIRRLAPLALAALAAGPVPALAGSNLPSGGTVQAGSATITQTNSSTLTINQSSPRAVIDWTTFNIGAGNTTQFVVPGASSITLNRVTGGQGPSEIYGTLKSNGQLVLVNPAGIVFGPGSVVDVAGLVASTHDIRNADFMAGRMIFDIPGRPDASIINAGTITVKDYGFAALVAPGVRNEGIITARLGTVALAAAGDEGFTLDLYGDGLINLKVDDQIAAQVKDVRTGQPLSALVSNTGTIRADGGRIALTASTARVVVDNVINNTGVLEANSVGFRNGQIVLSAQTAGTKTAGAPAQKVSVSGAVRASGQHPGQTGGRIVVTGEELTVASAHIDATGAAGGGTVLLGGDRSGGQAIDVALDHPRAAFEAEPVPTAATLVVEADVVIDVSATGKGAGGKAILWSDTFTRFSGTVYARGGPVAGDGGFVEVSSATSMVAAGVVDTSAPAGRQGLLLLDPDRVYVVDPLSSCLMYPNPGCGGSPNPPPYYTISFISSSMVPNSTIVADVEIVFQDSVSKVGTVSAVAPTIIVNASITATDISFNASTLLEVNEQLYATNNVSLSAGTLTYNADITGMNAVVLGATTIAPSTSTLFSEGGVAIVYYGAGPTVTWTNPVDTPSFLLNAADRSVIVDSDIPGAERIAISGHSVKVTETAQLVKPLHPDMDIAGYTTFAGSSLYLEAGLGGLSIAEGATLQADVVWLGSGGLLVSDATLTGRDIQVFRTDWNPHSPTGVLSNIILGGTIDLQPSNIGISQFVVMGGKGSIYFDASLTTPTTTPSLVVFDAAYNVVIDTPLTVNDSVLINAGRVLRLNQDVVLGGAVIPGSVGLAGPDLGITGGLLRGADISITRTDPNVGVFAVAEGNQQTGYNIYDAGYLASLDNVPGTGIGTLTAPDLLARGITVPAQPTSGESQPSQEDHHVSDGPTLDGLVTFVYDVLQSFLASDWSDTFQRDRSLFQQIAADPDRGPPGPPGPRDGNRGAGGPLAGLQNRPVGPGGLVGGGPIRTDLHFARLFDVPSASEGRFEPNQLIVQVDRRLTPDQIAAIEQRFGLTRMGTQDFAVTGVTFGQYQLPPGQDIRDVIRALSGDRGVVAGQPNYHYVLGQAASPAQQPASVPARPLPAGLPPQFAIDKLRLPQAHQVARGREVTIAVIDSTIDRAHPELADSIRTTIDATGGGEADPHDHGTGMAGAIAAHASLTGTAPSANLVGITAFRTDGRATQGTTLSILRAIDLAYREGARVVNMSFAGPRDPLLARALAEARARGMILIAAAGNAGPQSPPLFPAADPNVIAVTAIDADDRPFDHANRGRHIAVAAPGVDVLVPAPGGNYEFTSGTSVATAYVSGVVALMLERDPRASLEDIRDALARSARDQGPRGPDAVYGAGVVDAYGALEAIQIRTASGPRGVPATARAPAAPTPTARAPNGQRITPASYPPVPQPRTQPAR